MFQKALFTKNLGAGCGHGPWLTDYTAQSSGWTARSECGLGKSPDPLP